MFFIFYETMVEENFNADFLTTQVVLKYSAPPATA